MTVEAVYRRQTFGPGPRANWALTSDGLDPRSESVPGCGLANRNSYLLDEDEVCACPHSGAVKFAGRPKVVASEEDEKNIGEQGGSNGVSVSQERPTSDRSDQQCEGADEDEAFVACGIGTIAEGEEDERGEDQHVGDGNDVEEPRIASGRASLPDERIGGGKNAKDHHKTCKAETSDAETAVSLYLAGGDERSLRHKQENPAGERGSVNMDDEAGQGGMENSGEIVGSGESQEDGGQHEYGHHGEKEMVKTPTGQAPHGFRRGYRAQGNGRHGGS